MENLTAVEWLMKELSYDNGFGVRHPSHNELAHLNEYFDQAKEMEKQQIMDAYWDGGQDIPLTEERCEQYYKKTFIK